MTVFLDFLSSLRSQSEAAFFKRSTPTESELDAVTRAAIDVLRVFPPTPGACAMMTALLSVRLENRIEAPTYVVAGTLDVVGTRVFGRTNPDWPNSFGQTDLAWDGHCWLMIGSFIADISIARTAYSARSAPVLRDSFTRAYGSGRGFIRLTEAAAMADGFDYRPQHLLTQEEINDLARGAMHLLGSG